LQHDPSYSFQRQKSLDYILYTRQMIARFNKSRHAFGKLGESELLPLLESYLGEKFTPTERSNDMMDAYSANYYVEIKTRSPTIHWSNPKIQEQGCLMPACKIQRAREEAAKGKKVSFFYFWKCDGSIWELPWSEEVVEGLTPFVPFWHPEKQLHYTIPVDRWYAIEYLVPPQINQKEVYPLAIKG
jgi:hypothetical protein